MIPEILKGIIAHASQEHKDLVERAYLLAYKALEGEQRGNGHPFIEHPLGVASIVANEIGLMPEAVAAVFLHEATRGNDALLQQVAKEYPQEVITMVEGLNRISGITPKDTRLQAENYRKLIVSYSKDPRVTLIKLADRLEIMRNLELFPKSSIMRKVTETIMLYIPLAHQLGMYNLKSELEDLYFKHSDPENYRAITNKLKATQGDREKLAQEFVRPLEVSLRESGISYKLKVRTKTAYSIWKKMQKQNVPFEKVYDVFAMRFILDVPLEKEHDYCWEVYSRVTQEYKPDTKRLRDWITNPKPNGYESLHTTVQNKEGAYIEVQIRTARMDDMAENGHASHWSYKGIKSVQGLDEWLKNVKSMLESSEANPYTNAVQTELDEIFVFTPTGDLKQLPKGASVLDFAFNIHSNLGVKCSGARVNGKIASIKDELHTGDVVEIMSNKNQKPSADWLKIVVSSKARNRIKAKLKEEEGKLIKLGRELLERRMKNWKMELNDDVLADIAKHYKMKASAEVFLAIYEEKIDLLDLKDFLTNGKEETLPDKNEQRGEHREKQGKSSDGDYLVISDKLNNISFKMAKCCNPIFGDDVFGFVSATGGIKIHRISCPNAARLLEMYPYRVQKVRWKQVSNTTQFQTALKVIGDGDASIGAQIMDCVNKQAASIRSFSISERRKPGNQTEFVAELGISVGNNAHLDRVTSALKKIREVKTVLRTSEKS
ncbi:MAG: bifunctional (p)ppGpp synthetase/guanosine-3',5'-bis(diphosphate) 3'-pyrophosphohydrolase [Bacteroidales bacterium]|nr:bifunctional (p)ppGpp synthetase/guanosine-3',5'-bis(diphosphate) 3'-pyrophosphohydrolase [Bacteroidales bacterium]